MNYISEDNFNFFNELNKEDDAEHNSIISNNDNNDNNDNNKMCMISHLPITYNSVTLPCNHTFNYMPLYNELSLIHNHNRTIKCPYCRKLSIQLLPYIPLPGVAKKYGINIPKTLCLDAPKCLNIIKSGNHKGLKCGKDGMEGPEGTFCKKHLDSFHLLIVNNNNKIKKTKPIIIWTNEKEDLFKRKTVTQLKQMLKEKGMKVVGLKKDLVNRIFIYNAANSNSDTHDMISLL
jgi:hypothetical protein